MRRALLSPIATLALLAGCGGDDSGFTAEQFVGAVNQRGAALELGAELRSTRPDATVFAVEVGVPRAQAEDAGDEALPEGETHTGGSLAVMPDAAAGLDEYRRCEQAATLLCFRADNVVLVLEGEIDPAQIAALSQALRAIAEETSG